MIVCATPQMSGIPIKIHAKIKSPTERRGGLSIG